MQPQGPPEQGQMAQGPPGQEGEEQFSHIIDEGGTMMSDMDKLMMAAEISFKQQQQPDYELDEIEQRFVEEFFPGGIPPEFAQFAAGTKEQSEAAAQPQEQMGPPGVAPAQPVGPPGAQ